MTDVADPRVVNGAILARRVAALNARTLVVQIRTWGDFATPEQRTALRNLANRAAAVARELEELAA